MTIRGESDDATAGFLPFMRVQAEGHDAVYRQDDAPPGAASASEADGLEQEPGMSPPARTIGDILAALRSTPGELERLIQGQSEESLAQPASDGEWGVVEIVPHLRDWEEVYLGWARRLLDEDRPTLASVDDSLWAIEHDYAGERVADALAAFRDLREELLLRLETLAPDAWERQAVHPRLGRLTLHQLADRMCDHDARHVEQARDALA